MSAAVPDMMSPMSERLWNELRSHLSARREHGWYLDEDEMGWCFGLGGACRLVVTARGDRIAVYDADEDTYTTFAGIDDLLAALPALEQSHRGFSAAYRRILDSDLHVDAGELAEHQRQLAAQDAALDAQDP
jgi:hypothetical protein